MRTLFYPAMGALLITCFFSPAMAQSNAERIENELKFLHEEMEDLKDELEEMKKETSEKASAEEVQELSEEVSSLEEGVGLLGRVSIGAYGVLHYNDFETEGKDDQLDFHRFVIFLGY